MENPLSRNTHWLVGVTAALTLGISASGNTLIGKVKQINSATHQVAIEPGNGQSARESDTLVLTLNDGTQCRISVIAVRESLLFADTKSCDGVIRVGDPVDKDLFAGLSPSPTPEPGPSEPDSASEPGAPVEAAPIVTSEPQSTVAAPESGTTSEPGVEPLSGIRSKKEDWYTYWGLGLSRISYSSQLQPIADSLSANPGVTHVSMNFDLLGFYWPMSEDGVIAGFVLNAVADRWEDWSGSLQLNQYTLGFSLMYYFSTIPGEGIFLRLDAGPSWYNAQADTPTSTAESDSGVGFGSLFGLGYGIPISPDTRLLLNLNYTFRNADSESIGTYSFSAGFLF